MNIKKFEIPYAPSIYTNEFIERFKNYKEFIECVYFASYKGDGKNTREKITEAETYPKTFDEYCTYISDLSKYFVPQVLLQKQCNLYLISKYYDLGIKRFTINDDLLAQEIKEIYPDIILTLSITRRLKYEDIITKDLSMYDYIVLDFWFLRHLQYIERLPKKYKYIIIPNTNCKWNFCSTCPTHWFNEEQFKGCFVSFEDSARIFPSDLSYFDNVIDHYKLQGRDMPVDFVRDDLLLYLHRDKSYYALDNTINNNMVIT